LAIQVREDELAPRVGSGTPTAWRPSNVILGIRSLAAVTPDADHARAFVAGHDPDGQFATLPQEPPIGQVVEIDYNGIKTVVRVDRNGRVTAYAEPVTGDGW
jgi:hypothetical protein